MFIELTQKNVTLLINVDNITDVYESPEGTFVCSIDRDELSVDQSYAEVRRLIGSKTPIRSSIEEESMTLEKAKELAAQAWCGPETGNKVFDKELCDAFAEILYKNK